MIEIKFEVNEIFNTVVDGKYLTTKVLYVNDELCSNMQEVIAVTENGIIIKGIQYRDYDRNCWIPDLFHIEVLHRCKQIGEHTKVCSLIYFFLNSLAISWQGNQLLSNKENRDSGYPELKDSPNWSQFSRVSRVSLLVI